MPRPGPRRPLVAFKLADEVTARIDALAVQRGVTRSEQIRLMLEYAEQNMPAGWVPSVSQPR